MNDNIVSQVLKHPKYQELVRRRTRVSMMFFVATLIIYSGFILTMAYLPEVFAQPLGETWTMSVGLLVVCSAVLMIALYVWFSNKVFDPLLDAVLRDVQ